MNTPQDISELGQIHRAFPHGVPAVLQVHNELTLLRLPVATELPHRFEGATEETGETASHAMVWPLDRLTAGVEANGSAAKVAAVSTAEIVPIAADDLMLHGIPAV